MLLHNDDVVYQILQWLPVISLLRFKLVCKTWRALIESNDFIKQHLHHHHYSPSLKDKNHSLIHLLAGNDLPFTFPLISIDSFAEPNTSVQLDCSELHGRFPLTVLDIVSYNGIVCLNLVNFKEKYSVCLWNPTTKQSRVLPQSPTLALEVEYGCLRTTVGFGFDVRNNDYKVVNLCINCCNEEERVEVYSLNTDSWRSVTTVLPFTNWLSNRRVPFNNGSCFFWDVWNSGCKMILCFDFSSEKFRSISFPNVNYDVPRHYDVPRQYAGVLSDKIACVFNTKVLQTEIWVLNEYGSVNESWVKLYEIDTRSTINWQMSLEWLSVNGNYLFFSTLGRIIRYNVVTKEMKDLRKSVEVSKEWPPRICFSAGETVVEFKESLLSVGKGNNEWIKKKRNDDN